MYLELYKRLKTNIGAISLYTFNLSSVARYKCLSYVHVYTFFDFCGFISWLMLLQH